MSARSTSHSRIVPRAPAHLQPHEVHMTKAERATRVQKWRRLQIHAKAQAVLWRRRILFRTRKVKHWQDARVDQPATAGPSQMYDSVTLSAIPAGAPAVAG